MQTPNLFQGNTRLRFAVKFLDKAMENEVNGDNDAPRSKASRELQDCGIDSTGKPIMRRGPKETSPLEYARAAYWACNLSHISGMSFTELERLLTPWVVKPRDGGGYLQPYAFKKYATGQRIPTAKGDRSPIKLAEDRFPGSIAAYKSILWEITAIEPGDRSGIDLTDLSRRVNQDVIKELENGFFAQNEEPILNETGKLKALALKHIDAFALMLLTIRTSQVITLKDVNHLQSWLLFNSTHAPFSSCADLLFGIFEEIIPELGIMTGPLGFMANQNDPHFSALVAALTSGRIIGGE
jgi:hypothetical protein